MAAVSDVPSRRWDEGLSIPDRVPLDLEQLAGGGVDRSRGRGLDLTPDEVAARRRNRRWMLGLAIPSVAILVLALVATAVYQANLPSGPRIAAPPGYKAVNDGYFSYVVPSTWATNGAFTDSAGDVETSGPNGWVGEHIDFLLAAPALDEAQPESLQAFGEPRPEPYELSDGHPIPVKGAAVAYLYTVIRAGGFRAVAVDAWDARADVEIWLMVDAPPAVTTQLLGSLQT
jgi:hypothetical protein